VVNETPSAVVARTATNVRRSEWVLWAFLAYTAILAAVAPLPLAIAHAIVCRGDLLFEIELDAVAAGNYE